MSEVYRGRDMYMNRDIAIKVLREVYSTDPKCVTRFQRQAKATSTFHHPAVVQVYDYGQSDGMYYTTMELVEGMDLRRFQRVRGIFTADQAIIIAHDVGLGLGAAHRVGVVHRGVNPLHVLIGNDGAVKLTAFGALGLGTNHYYSPEQLQGEIVTFASDVYALGIVMYEMLTGRTPFDGDTPVAVAMQHILDAPIPPRQFNSGIPSALEKIVLRCMEKVPELRYRDGTQLAHALEMLN
jgi:serine/threonine-protein kinase